MQIKKVAIRRNWAGVVLVGALAVGTAGGSLAYNFDNIADGAAVASVSGWTYTYYTGEQGRNTGIFKDGVGYGGSTGLKLTNSTQYMYTLSSDQAMTAADGPLEFRFKVYITSDNWPVATITIAESGGVNGMKIGFYGQNPGTADNLIQVSKLSTDANKGTDWGHMEYTNYTIPWAINTWYEVIVTNIALQTTGNGKNVTGTVRVVEAANPSNVILEGVPINGFGTTTGSFDKINTFVVDGAGAIFDDFSVSAVPEPAALGMLGVGLGSLMMRKSKK